LKQRSARDAWLGRCTVRLTSTGAGHPLQAHAACWSVLWLVTAALDRCARRSTARPPRQLWIARHSLSAAARLQGRCWSAPGAGSCSARGVGLVESLRRRWLGPVLASIARPVSSVATARGARAGAGLSQLTGLLSLWTLGPKWPRAALAVFLVLQQYLTGNGWGVLFRPHNPGRLPGIGRPDYFSGGLDFLGMGDGGGWFFFWAKTRAGTPFAGWGPRLFCGRPPLLAGCWAGE